MKYTGRKGWIASRTDAFSLTDTLRPIIASGLKKFLEEKDHAMFGVPSSFGDSHGNDEVFKENFDKWIVALETMVYAFENKEPEAAAYDFEYYWGTGEEQLESLLDIKAGVGYTIEHTNSKEYERYKADNKAHSIKVQEGLDLFAKHYENLWW